MRRAGVLAACAVAFLMATQHAARLPAWEGFDEPGHTSYVWYVATHRQLPKADLRLVGMGYEETHQPPVYYVTAAALVGWLYPDRWISPSPNPSSQWIYGQGGSKNLIAHHPARTAEERQLWTALRVTRMLNSGLAAILVALTFRLARRTLPAREEARTAALASWLVATLPQTAVLGGIVSNDMAVALACSLVLLSVLWLHSQSGEGWGWLSVGTVGPAVGVLTKFHALAVVPLPVVVLILSGRLWERRRLAWAMAAAAMGVAAFTVWSEATRGAQAPLVGVAETAAELQGNWSQVFQSPARAAAGLAATLRFMFLTFPGVFGWGLVQGPGFLYQVVAPAWAVALTAGAVLALRRPVEERRRLLLLIAFVVGLMLLLVAYAYLGWQRDFEAHGRRLFTAVSAMAVLAALALSGRARPLGWGLVGLMLLASGITVWRIIPEELEPPAVRSERVSDEGIHARFGEALAVRRPEVGFRPERQEVTVRFELQRLAAERDYALAVTLQTVDQQVLARQQRYPGHGRLATSRLPEGSVVEEVWRLDTRVDEPVVARVWLSAFDFFAGQTLTAMDGSGQPLGTSAALGRMLLVPAGYAPPEVRHPIGESFGDAIRLEGWEAKGCQTPRVRLRMIWLALRPLTGAGSVFVHGLGEGGALVGQADGLPFDGQLPLESWPEGVPLLDERTVEGSAPVQTVRVGIYDPASGRRLPASGGGDFVLLDCRLG